MNLADALAELNTYNAWHLSSRADCGSPDTKDSAGAQMLLRVRDAFVEAVEYDPATWLSDDYTDSVHEIADGAPSVYTHEMWSQFVDLTAYNEDLDDLGGTTGDMQRDAAVALYIIAERLVHVLHEELTQAVMEDDADDADA